MNKNTTLLALTIFFILIGTPAYSSSDNSNPDATKKFGIGLQAAPFPCFGLSAIYNQSEKLSFQAFGRVAIDVDFVAFRGIYRFIKKERYNLYTNILVGYFVDDQVAVNIFAPEETDKTWGVGCGAGFEYFFSKLPHVGWNLEADYIHIDFERKWWKYDNEAFNLIMLGIGIHYYF